MQVDVRTGYGREGWEIAFQVSKRQIIPVAGGASAMQELQYFGLCVLLPDFGKLCPIYRLKLGVSVFGI